MSQPQAYGLLGWPVSHSLSPAMHNAAFKALKLNCHYALLPVPPAEADHFLDTLDSRGLCGLNVTIPYKEKALGRVILDAESVYLKTVGAVNTLVKREHVWKGFNTDIPGFLMHLKEQFNPQHKKCAIIGAGGASRAVAYALAQAQAKELAIFDLDTAKADAIVAMLRQLFPAFAARRADAVADLDIRGKDLLVNATPVGMKAQDPLLVEPEWLNPWLFVYDLIYNPAETALLALARQRGCRCANGLGMLLYQGMLSFEIWTNKKAPKETMLQALEQAGEH